MSPLAPGSVIGILGGGQLGRMLALAAARLGFDVHVFAPEHDGPAARVAAASTIAPYEDLDAVAAFASGCAAVTYEFENVPLATAEAAAAHAPLRPGVRALDIAQDRLAEKTFARDCGADTVDFRAIDDADALAAALAGLNARAVLKTRRLGYDGKGQAWLSPGDAPAAAWDAIGRAPAILEAGCDFVRELSQLIARGADGAVAAYPLAENTHQDGVLRETRAPARASAAIAARAVEIAAQMARRLDYVGVLAVELFETADGALLVNEIAPRVHNSGHWTQDACACCQFEQHIRAVAGWPLGDANAFAQAVMTNILGPFDALALAAEPGARVHLYAKREARPGRKMGHVTHVQPFGGAA